MRFRRVGVGVVLAWMCGGCGQKADHPPLADPTIPGSPGGAVVGGGRDGGGNEAGTTSGADVCAGDTSAVYFSGDDTATHDYIHPGADVIVNTKTFTASVGDPKLATVNVHLEPTDDKQGLWWDLTFSSAQLGAPLAVQDYTDAQRAPFADTGHPGLEISGDGRGCNTLTGSFSVTEISLSPVPDGGTEPDVLRFRATFEQHCEGGPAALRGCVRFVKP